MTSLNVHQVTRIQEFHNSDDTNLQRIILTMADSNKQFIIDIYPDGDSQLEIETTSDRFGD